MNKFYYVDHLHPKTKHNHVGLDGLIRIDPGKEVDMWTEPGEWELPEWKITTTDLSFEVVKLHDSACVIRNTSHSVIVLEPA